MSIRTPRTPSYRHHKPSGQAVVTLGGRDYYLGAHGSPSSRAEYDRLLAEWLATGRRGPEPGSEATVSELMVGYVRHVDAYYVKDGKPTSEATLLRLSLRVLRRLYGHTPARDFGPLALKACRQAYVDAGLCRNEVNRRTGHIVRFFKWAVANELVPPSVHHGLKAVDGLRKGRTDVRESEPVRPVPDEHVDAIEPYTSRQVWAMVELQRLTGMRPGEVINMRTGDIDRSGDGWAYVPSSHKTEHHDRQRRIPLGPRAREVLKPWLRDDDPTAYLFSPAEAMAQRKAERRAQRKTPVQPSQRDRSKARPKKAPGDRYTSDSYRRAIQTACKKAGVSDWHPNQLRHSAATRLRREFDLDTARAVLGHSSPAVTQVYAERDATLAAEAMERVG